MRLPPDESPNDSPAPIERWLGRLYHNSPLTPGDADHAREPGGQAPVEPIAFRGYFLFVTWLFVVASIIGLVVLIASAPGCDTVTVGRVTTDVSCDARNYYWFAVTASALSAFLFAMIMFALSSGLSSLARIEKRLESVGDTRGDTSSESSGNTDV